jgi:sugar phosphate permease
MFVAMAVVGLVWLLGWLFLVPDDMPQAEHRAQIQRKASGITLGAALRSPVVWGGMLTNFCYGYFTFYCMTWMPAYLVEKRGLSLAKSGVYTFFSFAGIAIMAVIAGWAADQLIARGRDPVLVRKGFVIAGFCGGCTVLLGAYASSLNVALFWNVFSLTALGLATANNLALCRLTLIPKPAVGLVTGVQQVATSLAGGVSASLSGWLLQKSGGYDVPMLVIFVFLLVGAVGTWTLLRPEWAPRLSEE